MGMVVRILLLLCACHLLVLAAALLTGAATLQGSTAAGVLASILLLLPPLAGAAFLPQRHLALPITIAAWSLATLISASALLPYPAASAVNAGLGLIGGPCSGPGELAFTILPDLSGNQAIQASSDGCPEPTPTPTPAPAPAPESESESGSASAATPAPSSGVDPLQIQPTDIVIDYTLEGGSIIVPVTFEGPGGRAEFPMIFDTGATLTTLNAASLSELGLVVGPDAPEITTHTAAGLRTSRLTLASGVEVGRSRVEPVSISVCEPCAADEARGLLGLNVSGRFLMTIDTLEERLILRPRSGGETKDVSAWVELDAAAVQASGGPVEVTLRVRNRSERDIARVSAKITCERDYFGEVRAIRSGAEASKLVMLPSGADCSSYTISIHEAAW
jgi:hypothetical protein